MRRDDNVGHVQQRVLWVRRFDFQYIQPGAGDLAAVERGSQCSFIYGRATTCVHQHGGALHCLELRRAHQMMGLGVVGRVHGDVVRALEQLGERHRLNAFAGHLQFADVGIVGNDMHAEGFRAPRHGAGNVAEGDQPQGLAPQARRVIQHRPAFVPTAFRRQDIHLLSASYTGQQQHHCVIGDLFDEDIRHVGHDDAVFGGGIHIHHVDTDAAHADNYAIGQAFDDGAADVDAPGGDQGIRVPSAGNELRLGVSRHFHDICNVRQRFQFEAVALGSRLGLRGAR